MTGTLAGSRTALLTVARPKLLFYVKISACKSIDVFFRFCRKLIACCFDPHGQQVYRSRAKLEARLSSAQRSNFIKMLSEPRAIKFETRLEWPPAEIAQFEFTKDIVRKFFVTMFESEFEHHAYQNIDLQGVPCVLSHRGDGGRISRCLFTDNSISIEEDKTNIQVDGFLAIVRNVLKALLKVCADAGVELPPVLFQRCRIQCTAQPGESPGSLELLTENIANVSDDRTLPFDRPPSFFGIRFRFQPVTIQSEDGAHEQEHRNFCAIRFETYSEDISQVWMEIAAHHFFSEAIELTDPAKAKEIENRIAESYQFLTDKCVAFLNQFDHQKPPPVEGKAP